MRLVAMLVVLATAIAALPLDRDVAVVLTGRRSGGSGAAPIAGRMMAEYLR